MNRMFAIVEREMRKFFRSPVLMIMSMMLPLVQLVILGNAFGGKIRDARVAVVDYDHGPQAVKVREAFDAVAANINTFKTVHYNDEVQAREDVRTGRVDAAVIIPAAVFAPRLRAGRAAASASSSTTPTSSLSASLEGEMQSLVDCAQSARHPEPRSPRPSRSRSSSSTRTSST